MGEIWINVIVGISVWILTSVSVFLLAFIPNQYRKRLLSRFWGKEVLGEDFVVSYGSFLDSRVMEGKGNEFRYVKRYHDGRAVPFVGPWGNVVADAEIRSASYIINTLRKYRKMAVPVMDDTTAFNYLNRTFVALGSSSSNQITYLILNEPNNEFLEFGQEGEDISFILDKKNGTRFIGFQEPVKKDYGIVLRIQNPRSLGNFFFVCAGLGEWGTSGASWYLATKWRDLQSEFGDASFGVVVEVVLESDESARRVFP